MSTLWRNGSASDSRSEGCVFKSRQGQFCSFLGVEHISLIHNEVSKFSVRNFLYLHQQDGVDICQINQRFLFCCLESNRMVMDY